MNAVETTVNATSRSKSGLIVPLVRERAGSWLWGCDDASDVPGNPRPASTGRLPMSPGLSPAGTDSGASYMNKVMMSLTNSASVASI